VVHTELQKVLSLHDGGKTAGSSVKKQVSFLSYSEHRVFLIWLPILLYCTVPVSSGRELWLGDVNKKTDTMLVSSTRADCP
jgi:hypothetical protein